MSTPFLIVRPWNFAHVFNVPLPSLLLMCFFCFGFFSPKMWGLLRPKYPKKDTKTQISQKRYKDPNIWREKKTKKRWRLGRGTLNKCAKFQGITLKNGVDIAISRNLGFYAWTSLYYHVVASTQGRPIKSPTFWYVWSPPWSQTSTPLHTTDDDVGCIVHCVQRPPIFFAKYHRAYTKYNITEYYCL